MAERAARRFGGRVGRSRSRTSAPGLLMLGVLVAVFAFYGVVADGGEWALVIAGVVALVAAVAAAAQRWRGTRGSTQP